MRNHGRDPCEVRTHDPKVARETPYTLGHRSPSQFTIAEYNKIVIKRLSIYTCINYNIFMTTYKFYVVYIKFRFVLVSHKLLLTLAFT